MFRRPTLRRVFQGLRLHASAPRRSTRREAVSRRCIKRSWFGNGLELVCRPKYAHHFAAYAAPASLVRSPLHTQPALCALPAAGCASCLSVDTLRLCHTPSFMTRHKPPCRRVCSLRDQDTRPTRPYDGQNFLTWKERGERRRSNIVYTHQCSAHMDTDVFVTRAGLTRPSLRDLER